MADEYPPTQSEIDKLIKFERMEAAYFAVPEHDHKHFELTQAVYDRVEAEKAVLIDKLAKLQIALELATNQSAKRKEQLIGFIYGCIASLLVTVLWWQLTKHFSIFR